MTVNLSIKYYLEAPKCLVTVYSVNKTYNTQNN